MVSTTATDYWNDSCSIEELTYAIERGAVGATSNPQIVFGVLKKEMHLWRDRIQQIILENPYLAGRPHRLESDRRGGCQRCRTAAACIRARERQERAPVAANQPRFYRDADAIVQQAIHFNT
jgi:transaldolase